MSPPRAVMAARQVPAIFCINIGRISVAIGFHTSSGARQQVASAITTNQSIDQFSDMQLFVSFGPGDLDEAQLNYFGRLRGARYRCKSLRPLSRCVINLLPSVLYPL